MKRVHKTGVYTYLFLLLLLSQSCGEKVIRLAVIETTDIHGAILPYDYTEKQDLEFSLAGTASLIKEASGKFDDVIVLDNGDNIQGQPLVYYYNFIDTVSPHIMAEAFNYLGYDAVTAGNHDIEAGHAVYDRLNKEYKFPFLAANAVDEATGECYFRPYTIIEKGKLRIAVFGLITPAIPMWLPPELYEGISFKDMLKTASEWMPEILDKKPDLIIGLFHSGWNNADTTATSSGSYFENGSAAVAWNIRGFDIIFTGHDHRLANEKFINRFGDTVLILNAGSRSQNAGLAEVELKLSPTGRIVNKKISGTLIDIEEYAPDAEFLDAFSIHDKAVRNYVNRVIGECSETMSTRESFFGPSSFINFIHSVQLDITKASISFAAPLSFDVSINEGPVTVGDMFKLYRYENMLYTMELTGEEIRKYLEYSYSGWVSTMKNSGDYLLNYRKDSNGRPLLVDGKARLSEQFYNFDAAAGINYTVDVSKPVGSRVNITGLTDGDSFEKEKMYRVAINSYRGNGGGSLLTEGAGLTEPELRERLVKSTEKDLRFYILEAIDVSGKISPPAFNNWKFIPENWVKSAKQREYFLLFGSTN